MPPTTPARRRKARRPSGGSCGSGLIGPRTYPAADVRPRRPRTRARHRRLRRRRRQVEVPDDGSSLLDVLRDHLGVRSAKDGCSPQGQCGCCTVLVDGAAPGRVRDPGAPGAPAGRSPRSTASTPPTASAGPRRSAPPAPASAGSARPGIVVPARGPARPRAPRPTTTPRSTRRSLAHLCRCTGWRTILEAWAVAVAGASGAAGAPEADRDLDGRRRAGPPSRAARPSASAPDVALGRGGFADDTAPADALVAVPDGAGRLGRRRDARRGPGRGRQGAGPPRRPSSPRRPLDAARRATGPRRCARPGSSPPTSRPTPSWCEPGGEPATPLGQRRRLRRQGDLDRSPPPPARWPTARPAGAGAARPARTPCASGPSARRSPAGVRRRRHRRACGWCARRASPRRVALGRARPGRRGGRRRRPADLGRPSAAPGWAEAAVLLAGLGPAPSVDGVEATAVVAPGRGRGRGRRSAPTASCGCGSRCGAVLDEVVLRSYASAPPTWPSAGSRSEGLAVDADGDGRTTSPSARSGCCAPSDMPPVEVDARRRRRRAGERFRRRVRRGGRRGLARRRAGPPTGPPAARWRAELCHSDAMSTPVGPYTPDRPGRRLARRLRPGRPRRRPAGGRRRDRARPRQAIANLAGLLASEGAVAGRRGEDHGVPAPHARLPAS